MALLTFDENLRFLTIAPLQHDAELEAENERLRDAAAICAAKLCDIAELLVDAANALIAVIPNEEDGE